MSRSAARSSGHGAIQREAMVAHLRKHGIGYLMAVLGSLVTAVVRFALDDVLQETASFIPFVVPVMIAGWYGGVRPGVFATALCAMLSVYLFVGSKYSLFIESWSEATAAGIFIIVGVTVSLLCEAMHSARRRLEADRTRLADSLASEQRLAAQHAMTRVLAEAETQEEALPKALHAVADCLGWQAGAVWLIDTTAGVLRCAGFWSHPSVHVPVFESVTRGRTFERGVGLPGRVWSTGKPAWIRDIVHDGNFPRASVAAREGLHGAFAFPVVLAGEILGVTEFFSRTIQHPNDEILRMMNSTGDQLGQFIGRKRAEQTVREREQRFARFMQHLPGLAWIKDLQGRYVYVNEAAEKVFSTPLLELYGKTDDQLFPPETAALFQANDRRALESGTGVQVIETLDHDDGSLHSSIVSKFPIPDAEGRLTLVGGMAIDITEQKRAEAALQEADRRKDEFLATMAHELRNPLAPIRHAVQILKCLPAVDHDATYARDVIDRQVQQMVRLLDDLLDVSRISRNKLELERQPLELAGIIETALETSRPLILSGNHELTVSLPDEPVYLEGDPVRLSQVFANLLNNSAKYTPRGGNIWLAAQQQGSDVVVSIRDDGIGISAEMLPRLFEMFSQATPAIARSQGGLGIGLSLAKGLVELHGGSVEARSEGPGKGSEFTVRLPVMAQRPLTEAPLPADGSMATNGKCRVLIADDNRDGAESLATMLAILGHEVQTAYDGEQAVALAEAMRPEVVLLDIGMPKLNGNEAARQIREHPWGKNMLLVALTGWGREEDRRRTAEAGFDHHLVKPVEARAILELLRKPAPKYSTKTK
jgi:PAS domain S-box-containing protein